MKAILLAAASLMTGAGIYGVVHYNDRSANSEFQNLYREEVPAEPVLLKTTPEVKTINANDNVVVEKEGTKAVKRKPADKKTARKKKKISYKSFSRAAPEERIIKKASL